jgi:OPT oligopeptide transporter protein
MGDTNTYDRFGQVYNITRILNPDVTLNHTAYEEYSAMYLSPPYVSLYLLTFAISTCIISHTLLYHGRTLWNSFRNIDPEEDDIHAKLMKVYPEVPNLWYWGVVGLFFIIAAISVQVRLLTFALVHILLTRRIRQAFPTQMPIYALILSLVLPAVYMLPAGLIFAVTGQAVRLFPHPPIYVTNLRPQLSLNVLAQVIPGALLPGNPIANMVSDHHHHSQMDVA